MDSHSAAFQLAKNLLFTTLDLMTPWSSPLTLGNTWKTPDPMLVFPSVIPDRTPERSPSFCGLLRPLRGPMARRAAEVFYRVSRWMLRPGWGRPSHAVAVPPELAGAPAPVALYRQPRRFFAAAVETFPVISGEPPRLLGRRMPFNEIYTEVNGPWADGGGCRVMFGFRPNPGRGGLFRFGRLPLCWRGLDGRSSNSAGPRQKTA